MPYRKNFRRKTTQRKRLRFRRKGMFNRIPRGGMTYKNPTHFFKRVGSIVNLTSPNVQFTAGPAGQMGAITLNATDGMWNISTGNGGTTGITYYGFGILLTFDMLPDAVEFASLFDRYKIVGTQIKLVPFITEVPVQQSLASGPYSLGAQIHTIIDRDDAVAPLASQTGITILQEYESYHVSNLFNSNGKPITRYFKPYCTQYLYGSGGGALANAVSKPTWVNFAGSGQSIVHYGFKGVIQVTAPSTVVAYQIAIRPEATIYFKCKDLR